MVAPCLLSCPARLPVAILHVLQSLSTFSQRGLGPPRGKGHLGCSREGLCGLLASPPHGGACPHLRFPAPLPVPLEPAESVLGLWEGGAAATPEPWVEAGAFSGWHPALTLPAG